MSFGGVVGLVIMSLLVVVAARRVFTRRGRSVLGPAAIGSVYDMLNEDKRQAVQIVVEARAEARDPEDAEGQP